MDIRQTFRTAVRNLFANRTRFLHAVLGMLIGVAGVVFVLCCAGALLNFTSLQDEAFNGSLLDVAVMTNVDMPTKITPEDMEQLARDNPDIIQAVSPFVYFQLNGGVRAGDKQPQTAYLYGVGEKYLDMWPILNLWEGRFLNDLEIKREQKVCVLGNYVAKELFGADALGQTVRIWGENYTVIGITAEVASIEDYNYEVYIPYTNAQKMVGQRTTPNFDYNCTMYVDSYYVDANGRENMYNAQLVIEDMIQERTGREKGPAWLTWPTSMAYLNDSFESGIYTMVYQLMLCAGIVLVVGGVGIMNVMLATVNERTKEIGIRKAFGATEQDIKRQFSLEAIIISLIGSFIGICVGLLGAFIAGKFVISFPMGGGVYYPVALEYMDLPVVPILAAVAVAVLVGVIFGTYPAQQAAKMEIVDCISE